jgi:peptidoglycan hydrolase CwlO-like protein
MDITILNVKSALSNLTSMTDMNTVEINKSIMELNYKKEKLQNEVDDIQSQINFLASLRESQRMNNDERSGQSLFDQMFGG